MVIQRTFPGDYSLGSLLNTSSSRPLLSRTGVIALGGAVLLHILGIAYLYTQHITPMAVRTEPESPPFTVDLTSLAPDKPTAKPAATRVNVHTPTRVTVTQDTVITTPQQPPQTQLVDQTPKLITLGPPGGAGPDTAPRVIRDPNWLSRPSAEELNREYPERALTMGKTGVAFLDCTVTASGALAGCSVASETPAGFGFGSAALRLSKLFKMSPRTEDGLPVGGASVHIPLRFNLAG